MMMKLQNNGSEYTVMENLKCRLFHRNLCNHLICSAENEQIKNFDSSIGIDGIILTKADIDEKGGTALSTGYITKKPILYLGTGQEYDKIESFDKEKFLEKLGLNQE